MSRLLILCLILLPNLALAFEEEIPAPLSFDTRNAENYRWELTPYFGDYFGDKLNHSFVTGGTLQMNLIPQLGIMTGFGYSRANTDQATPLAQSLTNRDLYIFDGGFVVTKPAAYGEKKRFVEADFYTQIGGGVVQFNNRNRGMGFIGGGMKTRFRKISWLAIKVELQNYFFSIPNPGGSDFEYDLTLTLGPTFLLDAED